MSKTFRPYDPDQQLLLPAALQEWLPPDHLAYFISDVVDQLDLSTITARCQGEERGGPPYHPRMTVKVLLYGYCTGVASSRRIARHLCEDIAFRVLAANNTPDFRTISDFRKDHLGALGDLFLQVLELCQQAGLLKLGHMALDGTKVRANASKHKAMSYGRMKGKEGQLAAEVDELLRRAGEVDDDEDRRYGRDKRGDELPEELAFRESRLRKIREAKSALEAVALAEAKQAESEGRNHPGVPDDGAQQNFTDPDSRIMPAPGGRDSPTTARRWSGSGGPGHQPAVGQGAGGGHGGGGHRQCGHSPQGGLHRRRVLLGEGGGGTARAGSGPVHRAGEDPPRQGGSTCAPGPYTPGNVGQGADAAQAADETGAGTLRPADGDGGAGVRTDQAGPGFPAVPAAGPGEGQPGMAAHLRRPQPAEAVPVRGRVVRQWTRHR